MTICTCEYESCGEDLSRTFVLLNLIFIHSFIYSCIYWLSFIYLLLNRTNERLRYKEMFRVVLLPITSILSIFQVIYMASTLTCYVSLNMVAFLQKQTICFWETMWIEESSPWKPFAFCLPTKSNIQKTSSYWEEIMSVQVSTGSMASMMNVSALATMFEINHSLVKGFGSAVSTHLESKWIRQKF